MRNAEHIRAVIASEFRNVPPRVLDCALAQPSQVPLAKGVTRAELFVRCIFGMPNAEDSRWRAVQAGFARRGMPYIVMAYRNHVVIQRATSRLVSAGPHVPPPEEELELPIEYDEREEEDEPDDDYDPSDE